MVIDLSDEELLTEEEFAEATRRGEEAERTEPRGKSVRYDRRSGRIVLDLRNGTTFMFPARLVQGLQDAAEDEVAAVQMDRWGYGLHWDHNDIDISVPGLLSGIFGTRKYMAQLAGRATSPKKAAAARENGKKGGRPRKSA